MTEREKKKIYEYVCIERKRERWREIAYQNIVKS